MAATSDVHVLIVEDKMADIEITSRKLMRGMPAATHDVAKTTAQALERMKATRYHCILLDLNLPDALGASAVNDIRAVDRSTPIIVLTGFAPALTVQEVMKAGAQKVIPKHELNDHNLRDAIFEVTM